MNNMNHDLPSPSRIVWLDIVRLTAMLMVIGVHCIDPFYISPTLGTLPEYKFWASVYGSLFRPSVLYLYMPFFSAWIDKADRKMKQTYLWIWVISLFLPYMGEYISHYLYGTATWNEFGTLYYFAGFNGYLLLGHYVKQGNSWSVGKTLLLSALWRFFWLCKK